SGSSGKIEIPLLLTLFYLFRESEAGHCPSFWTKGRSAGRFGRKTLSGGEFGWGGTSVKR
ncbi:hypothetical protein LINPERHAP1_LOCUS41478, partial [Linum perenne]